MLFLYAEVLFFIFTTKLYWNNYYFDELRVSEIDLLEEKAQESIPLN